MLVAANNSHHHHGLGCNISVTLSDGQFVDNNNMNESNNQLSPNVSPKKTSFLDSLIRRSASSDNNNNNKKEKKSPTQSSWPNIFTRNKQSTEIKKAQEADEDMAKLIVEMELEGRSEAEIRMHLSYIHDVRSASPAPASPAPTRAPQKANVITQFFRDVQQAFREEVLLISPYPEYEYNDVSGLTISISSAPFFGAPPPEMDMTYEELSNLEPVYVGSTSINNLPTCKHDGTPLPGDQTKCPVCLCEFAEGEDLKSLPCVHFFHKECIDRWLMVGHSCPMCKTLVE